MAIFTKNKEEILNTCSIKQDTRCPHERCFSSISETDQRFSKNVCTNIGGGSNTPTFNKTSLLFGENSGYIHERCSPSLSETDPTSLRKIYRNLNVGSSNQTFNATSFCVGGNSEYKKQNSGSKFFYHCKKCDDHFFDRDDLKHHFTLFHSKDNKYVCGKCEKRFKCKNNLVKHIKKYDFQCVAKECTEKKVIKSDSVENVFVVTKSNSEELVEEGTEILKSNVISFERSPSILSKEYNDHEGCLCPRCGASFVEEELLKGHLKSCPHVVNEANGNLSTKLSPFTPSHASNITSKLKGPDMWYKCGVCDKTFPNRKQVVCHLKVKHNADMAFMCRICNVVFCSRHELGMHQSVHKGEKRKYTCKTCGMNVNDKYYFKNHLLVCQDKNIIFMCNICGKCFVTGGNLKMHSQTHFSERKYSCKYCHEKFKSSTTMHAHVRFIHMKLKPYDCGICNRVFAKNNALKYHFATHSDERPFVCEICHRGFKVKPSLVQHKKRLHSSDMKEITKYIVGIN